MERTCSDDAGSDRLTWKAHRALRGRGFRWAVAAAGLLVLAYVAVLAAANSLEHVVEDFLLLWYWMAPREFEIVIAGVRSMGDLRFEWSQ